MACGGLGCSCPPQSGAQPSHGSPSPGAPLVAASNSLSEGSSSLVPLTGTWASCVVSRCLAAFMGCVFSEMPLLVSTDPGAHWVPARSSSDRPLCCCSIVHLFKTVTQGWKWLPCVMAHTHGQGLHTFSGARHRHWGRSPARRGACPQSRPSSPQLRLCLQGAPRLCWHCQ